LNNNLKKIRKFKRICKEDRIGIRNVNLNIASTLKICREN